MRVHWNEYGDKRKIIRGYVQDEKGNPVSGAVVILEKFQPLYCGKEFECKGTFLQFMVTNRYGIYRFRINDITCYYKVKVFVKVCNFLNM